jgi:nucleotide-binding universal stress UspA family protein
MSRIKERQMAESDRQQSILVPLDGSELAEQVIPYARAFVTDGGDLHFLRVVADPEELRGVFGTQVVSVQDALRAETETAELELADTAKRWQSVLGAPPKISVATGDPAEAIVQNAESLECTMIAMAAHGRGMFGRLAFGSVADRVARISTVPVLILKAPDEEDAARTSTTVSRLVLPLDGSELANEALPVAASIAKQTGAAIHLVQVVNPTALVMPAPVGTAIYPAEMYQEIQTDLEQAARATLENAKTYLEKQGDFPVTTDVLEGPVVPSIESEGQPGDVIVMTSHGRSGFGRWLLGSVSEKLMRSGKAPVVLVPASARVSATSGSSVPA